MVPVYKKLIICPWFGPLPEWMDKYLANVEATLKPLGYDMLITTNLDLFKKRVKEKLGLPCNIIPGTGKVWDFRPAFGLLFEEELKGYDYWGHTDFDCIFGRIDKFMPDEELGKWDIHSNHTDYMCGPWTMYRNVPKINELFKMYPPWKTMLMYSKPLAWGEFHDGFTGVIDAQHNKGEIKRVYTFYQGNPWADTFNIEFKDGALYQDGEEIMMFHFRKTKAWPVKEIS